MDYIDLDGKLIEETTGQDKLLTFLYTNAFGRMLLKPLVCPSISRLSGKLLDTELSSMLVNSFIKREHVDMTDYMPRKYTSFNDFFTRKVKDGARPVDEDEDALVSPCDCRASVYPILENSNFSIKHTEYTLRSLLHSKKLASRFQGGYLYVLRLTVTDYHRYIYAATGEQTKNYRIEGSFHTVNPIANDYLPIYKENTREYTLINTESMGSVLQMEVGALLVGKIKNHKEKCHCEKGEEKGYFEFGGSTIVLLFKKDIIILDDDIITNSKENIETIVKYGEKIGIKNNLQKQ